MLDCLSPALQQKLSDLGALLVDQQGARVLVQPAQDAPGFWFGGGNAVRHPGGDLFLVGRFRDAGDSRSGLAQGARGRELALLRSSDDGRTFSPLRSWSKSDLRGDAPVLSIEGSALHVQRDRVRLLLSSEKERPYPSSVAAHQKPGTGVWSIDGFAAPSMDDLHPQPSLRPLLRSEDPAYLHRKDPSLSPGLDGGPPLLLYCAHPYSWSSSTSGHALLTEGGCTDQEPDFFPRGPAWDVAACRITCRLPVPRVGAFRGQPAVSLYFYDGAECLRPHPPHPQAVARPRGHSCEELGGLAWGLDPGFPRLQRLSRLEPSFVSPHGTGCNRYVSVLPEADGSMFVTWQRSAPSQAQPLVGHRVAAADVRSVLA